MQTARYSERLRLACQAACDKLRPQTATATIEKPTNAAHGDFACPAAMQLAKPMKCPPRQAAQRLLENLQLPDFVESAAVAGPGFINIVLKKTAKLTVVSDILTAAENFGKGADKGIDMLLEFVSANPTGPLHIGHGRAAAYGDSLANILSFAGFTVRREYYLNDCGRQVNILIASVWLRHWLGDGEMPKGSYRGDYLIPVAAAVADILSPTAAPDVGALLKEIAAEKNDDAAADKLTAKMSDLPTKVAADLRARVLQIMTADIKKDLQSLRVSPFDDWFSEQTLHDDDKINRVLQKLQTDNPRCLHESDDGALWLKTTVYGDDKDRVIRRANGQWTYFAADIAYHNDKLSRPTPRGERQLINILGADHHGYTPRLRAAVCALGYSPTVLQTHLIQLVALVEKGQRMKMSTRAGEFVSLSELIKKIGADAARYFYVSRKNDQHLDFDIALATAKNNANPVYYIQYAHARIYGIFAKWGSISKLKCATADLNILAADDSALSLCGKLLDFPAVLEHSATMRAPHHVAFYLHELAALLHAFYEKTTVLKGDEESVKARLSLLAATAGVIKNGLKLLGVSAPEQMR